MRFILNRIAVGVLLLLLLLPGSALPYWLQRANQSLDPAVSPEQFRPTAQNTRPSPGHPPQPVTITLLPLPGSWPAEITEAMQRAVGHWAGLPGSAMRVSAERALPREFDGDWFFRYAAADGRDTVEFVLEGWPWFWGPNYVAITVPKLADDGRMVEADIFLNAQDYRWMVFPREGVFPALAAQNRVDVEAFLTHELGHAFGLGHTQYSWAAMYELIGMADTRARRLTQDDEEGLRALYPQTAFDVPPPSIWGVHADDYPDLSCGMSVGMQSTLYAYVYRQSPLPGPHELIYDGDTAFDYCLFGSGFSAAYFQDVDLFKNGTPMDAVTGTQFISSNFVKAKAMNGSGGFPLLPTAAYDLAVIQSPGGVGLLDQGLFVNVLGNQLPEALILPSKDELVLPGRVSLDGTGSFDPEAQPLSYHWSIIASPNDDPALLSSDTAAQIVLRPRHPGTYVVSLTVNDGLVTSLADHISLRVLPPSSGQGDNEDFSPLGCALMASPDSQNPRRAAVSSLLPMALPLLIAAFLRKRRKRLQGLVWPS